MAEFLYYYDDRVLRDANKMIPPKQGEQNPKIIIALQTTPMDIIIDNIIFATKQNELKILRILAHGNPGLSALGKEYLNHQTVEKFKRIKDRFAAGGKIELHSCLVAEFCRGPYHCTVGTWLQMLADYTGVKVIAAQQKQLADDKWEWEGEISVFKPWQPGDDIMLGVDEYYQKEHEERGPRVYKMYQNP